MGCAWSAARRGACMVCGTCVARGWCVHGVRTACACACACASDHLRLDDRRASRELGHISVLVLDELLAWADAEQMRHPVTQPVVALAAAVRPVARVQPPPAESPAPEERPVRGALLLLDLAPRALQQLLHPAVWLAAAALRRHSPLQQLHRCVRLRVHRPVEQRLVGLRLRVRLRCWGEG